MVKKVLSSLLALTALLVVSYFFQPIKKGKGFDTTTTYDLVTDWPKLPVDLTLGNPTGIGIDTNQNIVVFHRADRTWPLLSPMPDKPIHSNTILIIDKESGQLLNSWGGNLFIMPHGLTVDKENHIWVTDVALHQVFKFSHDGKLLMVLGEAGVAGIDSLHFNKPTDIAIAKDGSFYVSDGYGNNRVVKFSPSGNYLLEWGRKGNKEGEFDLPHGLSLDNEGNVYVADRENNRIQKFTPSGQFIRQWTNNTFGSICAVFFDAAKEKVYVADDFTFLKVKHRGSDVIIIDTSATVQTRFGRSGFYQDPTSWYHDLTVDKEGAIYVGDILGNSIQKFRRVDNK